MNIKHKVVAWNIEWLDKLLTGLNAGTTSAAQRERLQARLDGIYQTIAEIAPDVLCITEGPRGEDGIKQFVDGLPGYVAVTRPQGESYHQSGNQWIWFVVHEQLASRVSLLPVRVWQQYTEAASPNGEHTDSWPVHRWGQIERVKHKHYRHPQVLVVDLGGVRAEVIGGHFKSKLTTVGNFHSPDEAKRKAFIEATLENRIKLATEAQNVRYYIDRRFKQERSPAVMVLGDLNDGPGKEFFERQFLFFDLLNNLQGDVFEAEKFLNHALFDYPDELRWTAHFEDRIEPSRNPHILLDHIMFTQAFVRGELPIRVEPHAGKVEHEIFDRITALLPSQVHLSDHKPVSCVFTQDIS
ncbi:MAG: hypothetical protein KJ000_05995 [Pirellulaceae bacterium]|nr:hypothetical protein [Pirellulaceae bacterium]